MTNNRAERNFKETINIFGQNEVEYWTHKWNVTDEELRNAILDCGSFRIKDIEAWLAEESNAGSSRKDINAPSEVNTKQTL